jgi:WD40 repeat protein
MRCNLTAHLPSHVMLPEHRLESLLDQARKYQASTCSYHVGSSSSTPFSLLTDHSCSRQAFPNYCTAVLSAHNDEVWTLAFSHNGRYLATAGADRTVCVWSVEEDFDHLHTLKGHKDGIFCLAWSPDDTILLSSADLTIKMWDPKVRLCSGLRNRLRG